MYRKIMVPLDGSRFAEEALPYAVSLARRTGAGLLLATVQDPIPGFAYEGWEAAAREYGEKYLSNVKEAIAEAELRDIALSYREGHVAEVLEEEAAFGDVDLVVMATHGRGALTRLWLGSVADAFVRLTERAVLLIRPPRGGERAATEDVTFDKVLIPLDGSSLSESALDHALELGTLFGASYELYRAVPYAMELAGPYLPHTVRMNQAMVDEALDLARSYLGRHAEALAERGLEVESTSTVVPQPGNGIVSHAEAAGCDLIAMATHGRKGLSRLMLGSTADKVLRSSNIPVLLHRSADS